MAPMKLSAPIREWIKSALQNPTAREKKVVGKGAFSLAQNPKTKEQVQKATWEGVPLLHFAAQGGYKLLFELLLEKFHVDVNTRDENNDTTVLHHLAATGQCELLKPLVETLAGDINAVDNGGSTPLCVSISFNQMPTMRLLLKNNASTQIESFLGMPIHMAAHSNNIYVAKKLLKRYPEDANLVCSQLFTPLEVAALCNSTECFKYLAESAIISAKPLFYKLICNSESEKSSLECINILLKYEMDPNEFDKDTLQEELPIICAAKKGWINVVEALLEPTLQISAIEDWSVQGILNYVQSDMFREMDRPVKEIRVRELRKSLIAELNESRYLIADLICKALHPDMPEEEWDWLQSLCELLIKCGREFVHYAVNSMTMHSLGSHFLSQNSYDLGMAFVAAKAAMALDPNDEICQNIYNETRAAIGQRAANEAAAANEAQA